MLQLRRSMHVPLIRMPQGGFCNLESLLTVDESFFGIRPSCHSLPPRIPSLLRAPISKPLKVAPRPSSVWSTSPLPYPPSSLLADIVLLFACHFICSFSFHLPSSGTSSMSLLKMGLLIPHFYRPTLRNGWMTPPTSLSTPLTR